MLLFDSPELPAAVYAFGQAAGGQAPGPTAEQAQADIEKLVSGQDVPIPENLTADYVNAIMVYVDSGEFDNLPPEIQQKIQQFVKDMKAQTDSNIQGQDQGQSPAPVPTQQPLPLEGATQNATPTR